MAVVWEGGEHLVELIYELFKLPDVREEPFRHEYGAKLLAVIATEHDDIRYLVDEFLECDPTLCDVLRDQDDVRVGLECALENEV